MIDRANDWSVCQSLVFDSATSRKKKGMKLVLYGDAGEESKVKIRIERKGVPEFHIWTVKLQFGKLGRSDIEALTSE